MYRLTIGLIFMLSVLKAEATPDSLRGFTYGTLSQPSGKEWESPEHLSHNKEQPKAYFFSFADVESARSVLPEQSDYWMSLNGMWDFKWSPDPDSRPKSFFESDFNSSDWDKLTVPSNWNIEGVQKDGSQKYGVPIYVNQPVIFQHKVAVDDWRGGVMRTPNKDWTTYKHRNEVGSYRREFLVPQDWDGRDVYLNFDGVDSFFYIWINGEYVGFSKNSRNLASFNITPYLRKGKNVLAVEVYRNSDGSFLEAQDMFRLPGIYRNVYLTSTPKVHIRDFVVIPDLDKSYTDGKLQVRIDVENSGKKVAKGYTVAYSLYENKLYSDENTLVKGVNAEAPVARIESKSIVDSDCVIDVKAPKTWSAEYPYRYVLVAELKDARGRVIDIVSTYVGFRKVEIKDTPASEDEFGLAGRYYYVNGKTVKLKGVNRHESNPETGHVISRSRMKEEVMLMKRANINHVRNAHYPDAPYWYYLCDKYGLYLEDEANIESHQYYYGDASLSHPKEWENAHVARVIEMTRATINNPSIVIWSLGNEAGPGQNFVTAYNELKKIDKSRPVQYERNNSIVDMGSNQYPSIAWMRGAVKGDYNIKYPFHVSEYAHSMGNACGNLDDYWEAMESTNFFCGAAIWDWVDQSMYNYDAKTGKRYLAYGGNFGDAPNDGQFVMNGIIFGDLEPKPQYFEVKRVYQHIDGKLVDAKTGKFEIFNKYYFTPMSDFGLKWSLYKDGREVQSGTLAMPNVAPRKRAEVTLPYDYSKLTTDGEYFVKVEFLLAKDEPWAKKGFVQAEKQFLVREAIERPTILAEASKGGSLKLHHNGDVYVVTGDNFVVEFDEKIGTITNLTYAGNQIIEPGTGPELDVIRAFVNNDNWAYSKWFDAGLHNLKHKVVDQVVYEKENGTVILSFTVESQAPNAARIHGGTSSGLNHVEELTDQTFGENDFKFVTNQVWTVYPDGSIELRAAVNSNTASLVLARLGYQIKLPKELDQFTYYGRGPINNYNDRKAGQNIEVFKSTAKGEFINFPKPQDMGNHEDVRWCALTNKAGKGALFIATDELSVSALPYSAMDMILASHPFKLPQVEYTYLNLDAGVTGLGGNSCGQGGPLKEDRIFAGANNVGFIIRPLENLKNVDHLAAVEAAGELPISISRSKSGEVTITSEAVGQPIMYKLGKNKPKLYTAPIALRDGGEITAWLKNSPKIAAKSSFEKIESIETTVISASSEESGSGNASHLTDGDLNTIWHTMYSVTVAKHPHWVDLDAGETKNIKGFTYVPRQSGGNGMIKDYSIHLSEDGKNWGEPVVKGKFDKKSSEKKVMFPQAKKARYIRFTALSSHGNQDFASASEIMILAD